MKVKIQRTRRDGQIVHLYIGDKRVAHVYVDDKRVEDFIEKICNALGNALDIEDLDDLDDDDHGKGDGYAEESTARKG